METFRHKRQMDLLIDSLDVWFLEQEQGFAGGNMFLYFSLAQVRNQDFTGPDVFVVLDVPKGERKSWVVWEEGKAPDVVIELLSPSTASHDKGKKKAIYESRLRVPEYFWFDPFAPDDLAGFRLVQGRYESILPDTHNRLTSQQMGLALVHWDGFYKGIETTWLRWAYPDGTLVPTAYEFASAQATQAQAEATQAKAEATQAKAEATQAKTDAQIAQAEATQAKTDAQIAQEKAQRLGDRLRQLGIDPNQV
jgi:Uma2 family endonuclease